MNTVTSLPPFNLHGPASPTSPVVLSVPHAGRDYPAAMLPALRLPLARLFALEDRHVDAVALAARGDRTAIVARRARAWIDLNRAEHERDPRIDDGACARHSAAPSTKVRGGLGLVPRQVGGADLWRRRLSAEEVMARIVADHRPYHAMIDEALRAAHARFGIAVLLDVHSMPPLGGKDAPQLVVGDRFGATAASRFVSAVEAAARGRGHRLAINTPYAGGHVIDRHAAPRANIHAIQLELDRSLYLDARLDALGAGFPETAGAVRAIADALADEAMPLATAAE